MRDTEVVDLKKGSLFPGHFQLFGVILIILGIAVIKSSFLLSLPPIIIGVLMVGGRQGTRIDRGLKTIQEYNSILSIKFGKVAVYRGIEKIFMNSSRQSQTFSTAHTMKSSTFKTQVYNAYLKLDDGTKIHLLTEGNKESLIKKVQPIAVFLNVELSDVTRMPS
jgi:hypothetical protein